MLMKTPPRPRIGITPDLNDLEGPETEYVVRRNYSDALGAVADFHSSCPMRMTLRPISRQSMVFSSPAECSISTPRFMVRPPGTPVS